MRKRHCSASGGADQDEPAGSLTLNPVAAKTIHERPPIAVLT